jgi:hypothetical protein
VIASLTTSTECADALRVRQAMGGTVFPARNGVFTAALKENKRWADVCSVISIVLVVCLESGTGYLGDYANADVSTRIGMNIVLVAVIIVVCIWQAAAFLGASIQTLFSNDETTCDSNLNIALSLLFRSPRVRALQPPG